MLNPQAEMDSIAALLNGRATPLSGTDRYGIAGCHVVSDGVHYDMFFTAHQNVCAKYIHMCIERVTVDGVSYSLARNFHLQDNQFSPFVFTVNNMTSRVAMNDDLVKQVIEQVTSLVNSITRRNNARQRSRDRRELENQEYVKALVADYGIQPDEAHAILTLAQEYSGTRHRAYDLANILAKQAAGHQAKIREVVLALEAITAELPNITSDACINKVKLVIDHLQA